MGLRGMAGRVAATAVMLVACSGDAREGAALALDAGADEICVPAPAGTDTGTIFGGTWLEHRGEAGLVFADITLLGPDGLTLTQSLLVPDPWPDGDLVGMRHTSDPDPLPVEWDDRVALVGATLQPAETRNLVIIVTADGSDVAAADGIRVEYEDARGRRYHQDLPLILMVAEIPCSEALGFDQD
jgi:hypothetical protein